jgi:hypothetical protein
MLESTKKFDIHKLTDKSDDESMEADSVRCDLLVEPSADCSDTSNLLNSDQSLKETDVIVALEKPVLIDHIIDNSNGCTVSSYVTQAVSEVCERILEDAQTVDENIILNLSEFFVVLENVIM